MKLLILHLSDIHFRESATDNSVLERTSEIVAAVGSLLVQPDSICIAVSGDIAFSGRVSEYIVATMFFDGLSAELAARFPGAAIEYFVVPGNHDCDFASQATVREMVLEGIATREFDDSVLDVCMQVQSSFWEFVASLSQGAENPTSVDKAVQTREIKVGSESVQIRLLNTALLSTCPEDQGSLLFPPELLRESARSEGTPPVATIALLHHPFNWFQSSNARAIRRELEATADIIITGHEHESDTFHVSRQEGEAVEYVEGAVLQDSPNGNASGFNVIHLDADQGSYRVHRFAWDVRGRYEQPTGPTELPSVRKSQRMRGEFVFRLDHEGYLANPGATYTHPLKDTITLDDIFVFPDLRVISTPAQNHADGELVRDGLASFLMEEKHVMILGSESAGKTTLAKQLVLEFRKRALVPLLVSGRDLKGSTGAAVTSAIRQAFKQQYELPDYTEYSQLAPSKRAIIVDDSQLIRSNARGRDLVVRYLEEIAETIVLLGEDTFRFDDLLQPRSTDLRVLTYSACQILPLGNVKRAEIIAKWVFLGRATTHDEHELLREAQDIERQIAELVGQSVCPPYPLFVLVLLQQLETYRSSNLTSRSSSYGYLYESLLTAALYRASQLKLDLDTQYSYLSELANHLFVERAQNASQEQLYDWNAQFCDLYGRRLSVKELIDNFISAGVLDEKEGHVSFKYPYLYYYFVSRYFSDHLEDEGIRARIAQMAQRLHSEEAANILLFLTYRSKEPFILESIIAAARQLFADHPDSDINHDTAFLGQLNIPKLVLDAGDPESRRKRMLAQRDEVELGNDDRVAEELLPYEETTTDDLLDDILRLNVAFKTMQILGQILRNYPGSLPASEKRLIANEAFSLGLRVLHFMIASLEQNTEDIVELLVEGFYERHPEWEQVQVERKTAEAIFGVTEAFAFAVCKQVADYAGDENLVVTFDGMLETAPNVSYKFIDLAIRLFYFSQFPENHMVALHRQVEDMPFPSQVLRRMVWYRFYLYPAKFDLRDRVCSRLDIEVTPALIGDDRPKLLPGT